MSQLTSYAKLQKQFKKNPWLIPYQLLLNTVEWKDLRTEILWRDKSTCTLCLQKESYKMGNDYYRILSDEEQIASVEEITTDVCGDGDWIYTGKTPMTYSEVTDKPVVLHVHHNYYIYENCPWDYPRNALVTVCQECHTKIHSTMKIPVYSDKGLKNEISLTPCSRCQGTGFMDQYYYYDNGICFRCEGRKFEELLD